LFAVDYGDDLHEIRFNGIHEKIRCLLDDPFTCSFDASRSSDPWLGWQEAGGISDAFGNGLGSSWIIFGDIVLSVY